MMTVYDRARSYVSKMDGATAGSNGHDKTFRVACILVEGFSLSDGDALELMREFNSRCDPPWAEHELEHKVKSAGGNISKPGYLLQGSSLQRDAKRSPVNRATIAEAPRKPKRPEFSVQSLRSFVIGMPKIEESFFVDRSVVRIPEVQGWECARLFLESVYSKGERILIFTNEMTQGQYLYEVGRGLFKLSKEVGVKAVKEPEWPDSGPCGVWYLASPVEGSWKKGTGEKLTRRSACNVTSWRWFILESDDADAGDWLKFLAKVPLPIAAIYTSGGRSYHALIDIGAATKEEWDVMRDQLFYQLLCPLGGDGGAMSAVRLSRLPGMLRRGKRDKEGKIRWFDQPKMQRLIYLNPEPTWSAVRLKGVSHG